MARRNFHSGSPLRETLDDEDEMDVRGYRKLPGSGKVHLFPQCEDPNIELTDVGMIRVKGSQICKACARRKLFIAKNKGR